MADTEPAPTTIKKYANRRLYDTAASRYVALDDLAAMVRDGAGFVVVEAKTGRDLTRTVLTQIVVEEGIKERSLLSVDFLRQLIGFHGDGLQMLLSRYLDQMMHAFAENQAQIRRYVTQATAGASTAAPSVDESGNHSAPNGKGESARLQALRGELAELRQKSTR